MDAYDKMAVIVALIASQIGSRELVEVVSDYSDARRSLMNFPSKAAKRRMHSAAVELKDAYEENRR